MILTVLLSACSVEKTTFTSLAYHNTTARYNSYYLAKEKIKEVEAAIHQDKMDNYARTLPVFPVAPTSTVASAEAKLEEAIKKASISIQYHKNSKWVDNCYILVGKSRFYKQDYENAIIAFKYVNTITDNDDDKAEALCWLARCYIINEQYEFAMGVLNHVRKLDIKKRNVELAALVESELYQKIGYKKSLAKNIEVAANNPTSRIRKARSNFIAGQVFQEIGENEKAFYHYKRCIRTNPEYEMEFYAKLNMAQVTGFSDVKDIKKIKKYFRKLLKDPKNKDYKDKIYYEIARFEFKQDKIDEAIKNLNLSIRNSTSNKNQKAYSYLMLGKINYENLQQYRMAANYYDSTMMFLSKSEPNFKEINKRAKILNEFVTQLEIIEKQDSMLTMASMDSTELVAYVDKIIEAQEKRRLALEEMRRKAEERRKKQEDEQASPDILSSGGWYFYNPTTVEQGKIEFVETWGDRKLEDHWRRSEKDRISEFDDTQPGDSLGNAGNSVTKTIPAKASETREERMERLRNQYIAKIPKTEAQIAASHKQLKEAYFKLGGIYHLKLEELYKANETYETLLERYPDYKKKIEVYYILFLVNRDINKEKSDYYKNLVLNKYPNSLYAKLILDPDYLTKNWQLNKQAELMYSQAYDMYENGQYYASIDMCDSIKKTYPENYIFDKIDLLTIRNISKTQGLIEYQKQLEEYIKKYKASPLKETAQNYLDECRNYIKREVYGENVEKTEDGKLQIYDTDIEGMQYFVLVIPRNEGLVMNDILVNLSDHNQATNASLELEVKHLIFNKDYFFITVKQFENKSLAVNYRDRMNVSKILENNTKNYSTFVITKANYSKLYKTKALEEYRTFFRNNYF